MKTKLLFENWRQYLNEDMGTEVPQDEIRMLRGDMDPLSKEELEALLPDQKIADPMNPRGAMQSDLMPLGKKDGVAYYKPMDGSWMQVPMESSGEFATAGGMEQDIEMRGDRGDFEQGDYGNVGPGGGEMMDLGEYPWIQDALEDLKDEEFPNKEKAIQSLAGELGMSVKAMPADMDMNERKTITKKKFNNTLYELVLEEVVEAISKTRR